MTRKNYSWEKRQRELLKKKSGKKSDSRKQLRKTSSHSPKSRRQNHLPSWDFLPPLHLDRWLRKPNRVYGAASPSAPDPVVHHSLSSGSICLNSSIRRMFAPLSMFAVLVFGIVSRNIYR